MGLYATLSQAHVSLLKDSKCLFSLRLLWAHFLPGGGWLYEVIELQSTPTMAIITAISTMTSRLSHPPHCMFTRNNCSPRTNTGSGSKEIQIQYVHVYLIYLSITTVQFKSLLMVILNILALTTNNTGNPHSLFTKHEKSSWNLIMGAIYYIFCNSYLCCS